MSDFSDMIVFTRVVLAGSMSAAGRELGLSPAVVSKRLKRLEERLETRLLQRTTRQIALTEVGQGYFDRVRSIVSAVEEAESFVAERSTAIGGTLSITAPTTFGRLHVAPHLSEFLEGNKGLRVNLTLRDRYDDLIANGFDVAIRIGALSNSSYIAKQLMPVRRVLCAAPRYLEKNGRPATIADLRAHSCLKTTTDDVWRLEGPDGLTSFHPDGVLQTNSNDVVRAALLGGLGIGLRADWEVEEEIANGSLVQILPDYKISAHEGIYAVYPSRRYLPAKVRSFIDFLAERYAALPTNAARNKRRRNSGRPVPASGARKVHAQRSDILTG